MAGLVLGLPPRLAGPLPSALPRIETGNALLDNVVFFLEKLPFLPVMAAVTFELQGFQSVTMRNVRGPFARS